MNACSYIHWIGDAGMTDTTRQRDKPVQGRMPEDEFLFDLADFFKVLGDTTRIKILKALSFSDMCVADIAALLEMTQSAISHQLRVLKQAHLVKFRREGKNIIYSLDDDHVEHIVAEGSIHLEHSKDRGKATL